MRIRLLGHQRLRYVDFALDFTCNQSCQHCFAKTYDHQMTLGRGTLHAEDYTRMAHEAIRLGAVSFSIQGGEPFAIYGRLLEVLRALPRQKCLISIKSNGTLISRERALELKTLGVDIVTISIDSGIAEEHDGFRKMTGAFEKAWKAVQLCHDARLKVMIACTVSHQNVQSEGLMKLVELTREKGLALLIIKAAPSGNWQGNEDILLTAEDSKWLQDLMDDNVHCRTDFDANYFKFGCGALKEIIYIDQYGNMMPCPFIQISFGNVRENSLQDLWQNAQALKTKEFSGYSQSCVIAEDREFIRRYSHHISKGSVPLSHTILKEMN